MKSAKAATKSHFRGRYKTGTLQFTVGVIGALVGVVVGYIEGANLGGNYWVSFELAGLRGYEAVGVIGAVIGASVASSLSVYCVGRILNKHGSLAATLAVASSGALLVTFLLLLAPPIFATSVYYFYMLALTISLCATIGYNASQP